LLCTDESQLTRKRNRRLQTNDLRWTKDDVRRLIPIYVCYCHDDQTDKLGKDKKAETHEANESSENEYENVVCMSIHVSIQTCLLVLQK